MQDDVKNLVALSKYAGERFDLVQAGGGNSSVKLDDGTMVIKASGVRLSEIEIGMGYTKVDNKKLTALFSHENELSSHKKEREQHANTYVQQATLTPGNKPSIETTLHTLLLKYVLHTHPITVNAFTCKANWKQLLGNIFADKQPMFVSYQTPGIDLAQELHMELEAYKNKYKKEPNIIFLQNHGMIVSANNHVDVAKITDYVVITLEKELVIDLSTYRATNALSVLINREYGGTNITYLSTDTAINIITQNNKELLICKPFCPDTLVYCGYEVVELTSLSDTTRIKKYKEQFNEIPKVLFYNGFIFFVAQSVRKAKEVEEQFKFHLLTLRFAKTSEKTNPLPEEELRYLANWDAEKYRQKL